jgi:arylsulfatase A-like enzyme
MMQGGYNVRASWWQVWMLGIMAVVWGGIGAVPAADAGDPSAGATRHAGPPNIIFILADDLGYGDLGCYGQTKIKTPSLDRLAREGLRFTSCYAGSTVCAPSRACLMTGQHTGHGHIRDNSQEPLDAKEYTVAELLKGAGYHTAAIGKWGLGLAGTSGVPNKKGFDEWFGYLDQVHAHNYYPDYLWRNDFRLAVPANEKNKKGTYAPDYFTRAALNYITANTNHLFFLYLAYTTPHANNELKDQGMEVPNDAPYHDQPWPQPEKNKAAMITRLDADVGKILAKLRELDMDRKTLIFFSSDNGPNKEGGVNPDFFRSAGPWRGIKRDLYEGGIRVPMLARWPGTIKAATVSHQVWAFWDFLPTMADLVGAAAPSGIDGISMLPALLGKPQKNHEYLYWEFHEGASQQALRLENWKAVRLAPSQPWELYDLKSAAGESTNVAQQYPDIVGRIEECLKTARTESNRWPLKPRPADQK